MANATSGMAVHDDCKLTFLELKTKRTHRFIVFKIEEKQKQVVVEKVGEPTQSYEDFVESLPADECRYVVYNFDFVTEENCQKMQDLFHRMVFKMFVGIIMDTIESHQFCLICGFSLSRSPDTARVRSKMIYASSKDRFKRELDEIQVAVY